MRGWFGVDSKPAFYLFRGAESPVYKNIVVIYHFDMVIVENSISMMFFRILLPNFAPKWN